MGASLSPLALVRAHLDKLLAYGRDVYGPEHTPMWMASLDIHTGAYPTDDRRPAVIGKRVYRNIDAPRGSSLYWDQPLIVAAHALSRITGDARYQDAADAYVGAFLERCVAGNGLFLWGNHYYYDAFRDQVLGFHGEEEPQPVDAATSRGELHETRPLPPAWESFWRVSPEATERAIRQIAAQQLFDRRSGGFNRHADGKRAYAFLEAGGILAETLAWLSAKTEDSGLADLALRVARFSWRHRRPEIGLPENSPTTDRWDKYVTTTEVGLWAGSLLRAGDLTGLDEFEGIAADAVAAYLRYGYDAQAERYWGRLRVADGTPSTGPKETPYMPGTHADLWNAFFPTHDYPMALAESCLSLWQRTGRAEYAEGARRWVEAVRRSLPARGGQGAYAESYGRCLHFCWRASAVLREPGYHDLAVQVAEEAIAVLYADGMFRGHPGEERYDAVDGVGLLSLALLALDTGQEPDGMGFGW